MATLFVEDEWNVLVWDFTTWGADAFLINNFDMRPFCNPAGTEAAFEGEGKVWFDDFELLF